MDILGTIATWATSAGIKIVIAIVILIIAFAIINGVTKKIKKMLVEKKGVDETLVKTLGSAAAILAKVIVVACLIGYLGIDTSGIAAVIASLGVCVGLAVNGTLSNLAGGVMIILTRPFKLGDFVEAQGTVGTVEDIRICYTVIRTNDNKVVYVPNAGLSTGLITNYSEKELRRVDLDFAVAGNDPAKVQQVLFDICKADALILDDPATTAPIIDYGSGKGMTIQLRAWTKSETYWDAYFAILTAAEKEFTANGIVVPFNQLDVHIKND